MLIVREKLQLKRVTHREGGLSPLLSLDERKKNSTSCIRTQLSGNSILYRSWLEGDQTFVMRQVNSILEVLLPVTGSKYSPNCILSSKTLILSPTLGRSYCGFEHIYGATQTGHGQSKATGICDRYFRKDDGETHTQFVRKSASKQVDS